MEVVYTFRIPLLSRVYTVGVSTQSYTILGHFFVIRGWDSL